MNEIIRVYGASWCPDCRRAKRFLGDQRISFEWHDIEADPYGVRIVQERNEGNNNGIRTYLEALDARPMHMMEAEH